MISIVTVSHKSYDLLADYIDSFLQHNSAHSGSDRIEFVFIENSGDDRIGDHVACLQAAGFAARCEETKNLGFGAGCNAGAALANGNLLVFANPDMRFLSDVSPLELSFGAKHWGTVAQTTDQGTIYAFDILPEYRGVMTELVRIHRFTHKMPFLRRMVYPVGSFFVVPREAFLKVGGFDERFFLYYEEAELSRRLLAQLGTPLYVREVSILHEGLGTQSSSQFTNEQEAIGMVRYSNIIGRPELARRRLRTLRRISVLAPYAGVRAGFLERAIKQYGDQV